MTSTDAAFLGSYNDDEPSSKPAVAAEKPAPPPAAAATPIDTYDEADHGLEHGAEPDTQMNEEYDEDDDDVDFNLGNGASTAHHVEAPAYSAPTPAPVAKGPNSKEDG